MLECVWAAELIAYKVSDSLDEYGIRKSVFQTRKMALNQARRKVQELIRHCEAAFDETFDNIYNHVEGEACHRSEIVQGWANDVIKLLLIYWVRGEGDMDKKDAMKKALLNFKATNDINIKELLKYYKCEL